MSSHPQPIHTPADLSAFRTHRAWQICIIGCSFTLFFVGTFIFVAMQQMELDNTVTINNDFRVFWAAARIAVQGDYLTVFDTDALFAVHQMDEGAWMPWLYPPGYLVLITPLGLVSYSFAWISFVILSIALMLLSARPFAVETPTLWLMTALAPTALPALIMGQNSILWCAGLLASFWALRDNRPILAGVLIGVLTLKPQLGLMIPIALIAIGAWRTIFSATITAVAIALLPTFLYGLNYWYELQDIITQHGRQLEKNVESLTLVIGFYSFFVELGFSLADALKLQWAVTFVAACLVFVVWRQKSIGWDLKFAMLLVATFISVPYLWHYEAAMFAPIALFLFRSQTVRLNVFGVIVLSALWIGLSPLIVPSLFGWAELPPLRSFAPIAIAVVLILILIRAWRDVQIGYKNVEMWPE